MHLTIDISTLSERMKDTFLDNSKKIVIFCSDEYYYELGMNEGISVPNLLLPPISYVEVHTQAYYRKFTIAPYCGCAAVCLCSW